MTTLYVREQGAQIRKTSERLLVVKDECVLETARLRDLERVALFGNVGVTSAAMMALMDAGIETALLSLTGQFRGRLSPAEGKNVFLRRAQFRRYEEDAFRVRTARALLQAKVHNGRSVLQRHHWNHPSPILEAAAARLEEGKARLGKQSAIASLLGVEGDCARVYFGALGAAVRGEFAFTTRTRRPPRDPVNALLSFGYALVTTELTGAIAAQGLDPYVGVMHDLDYGRPSLALDLLEEFRHPLVDRLALALVNRAQLREEHFERRGEGGVFLNAEGRPRLLDAYHAAVEAEFEERPDGAVVTFRALFQRQAARLRRAIEAEEEYEPFRVR